MTEWTPKKFFTEAEVEAAKTAKGGFSEVSLRKLGVPWPPPKGWRAAITRRPQAAFVQRPTANVQRIGDDPRKRTPAQWIALNPIFKYAFTKRELESNQAHGRLPARGGLP